MKGFFFFFFFFFSFVCLFLSLLSKFMHDVMLKLKVAGCYVYIVEIR